LIPQRKSDWAAGAGAAADFSESREERDAGDEASNDVIAPEDD
jgi:hypothetical protein